MESKQMIYNPEQEFNRYYETHRVNVAEYFDSLVEKSSIDKQANSKTCDEMYKKESHANKLTQELEKTSRLYNFLFVFLVLFTSTSIVVGVLLIILYFKSKAKLPFIIVGPILIVLGGFFIWLTVYVRKKQKNKEKDLRAKIAKLRSEIADLLEEAKKQMEPLNNLFGWNIAAMLFEKTIPIIDFDTTYSNKDYQYFLSEYAKNSSFFKLENTSTLSVQSGNILGNPFVFARNLTMQIEKIRYTGSKIVTVEYTTRDSQGNTVTITKSETLYASVIAPAPVYSTNIYLAYGNKAAPKLTFTRKPGIGANKLSPKTLDKTVDKEYKKIKKMEEKSIKKGSPQVFQSIANPKFEVLFNALDRNHEVEYRLLFTPVAQKAMVDLILNTKYQDYFTFLKREEINIIIPHRLSTDVFDAAPVFFQAIDNRKSRTNFINYNMDYFKTVYYFFAPLMSIPLYQQHKDLNYIYGDDNKALSSFFEQEVLSNSYSLNELRGDLIDTNVIINPRKAIRSNDFDEVDIRISGFDKIKRVENISVRASDGGRHIVSVLWYEYKPCYIDRKLYIYENEEEKDNNSIISLFTPYGIKSLLRRRRRFFFALSEDMVKQYSPGYKLNYQSGAGVLKGATYDGNPYDVAPYNEYDFYSKEEDINKVTKK